jgi:hypothetical protein
MEEHFLRGKTIRGMKVYRYTGCGGCPIRDCGKTLSESVVTLRHTGDERWDNWGRIVRAFGSGDVVEVRIKHDQSTVYCGTAGSTLYPGVHDYVNLQNFDEDGEAGGSAWRSG